MDLHDIASTPDSQHLIVVGTWLGRAGEMQPSLSRREKRIVGTWCCLVAGTFFLTMTLSLRYGPVSN